MLTLCDLDLDLSDAPEVTFDDILPTNRVIDNTEVTLTCHADSVPAGKNFTWLRENIVVRGKMTLAPKADLDLISVPGLKSEVLLCLTLSNIAILFHGPIICWMVCKKMWNLLDFRYWYLGLYSHSGCTSYHKISWSLEAAWVGIKLFQLLWNLTGTSTAALPRCLMNLKMI